ncbi:MAG: polyprenyl synthetase family protein [Aquificaceae bacterium]
MSKLELWKENIEKRLRELLRPFEPIPLYDAMSYYVFQDGKRVRPLLLCAVSDALGGNQEDAITIGCAIELIHNYSLVHDDLPAIDNDMLRRGKPTCHIFYGEDMAILAGDGLLSLTFEVLSNRELFHTLDEKDLLRVINTLAEKSGYSGMVGGQVMDIKKLGNNWEISSKKTASLFSACFSCGGLVSKRYHMVKSLETVGRDVGILFQIVDDYKDKDGFYSFYGEDTIELIEKKYRECLDKLNKLDILTEAMYKLIKNIVSPVSCT